MTSQTSLRYYARVMQHFLSTRAFEVLALQASPILGILLSGFSPGTCGVVGPGLLLLGSVALTAHVFVFNDWAGHVCDLRDTRRVTLVFERRGLGSRHVAQVAVALLLLANVAFAVIGIRAILLGAGITVLSLLYSGSQSFGKSTPIAASFNHLLGGTLHFLLGYTVCHALDSRGVLISLFFGLVFAAGHLNQEVRDYEIDLLNEIRTSAVVFGCRRTFLASMYIFTAAYAVLFTLAAVGILPRLLLWSVAAWLLHVLWSVQALRRGLRFETAIWMQRRYRLLFAFIGIAMLIR
ncbi:MAG TPA: UbiA family prenyltransferase [Pyrinomonadaceae bacterium]|nr:UbiA family prenyltransferase [Pyrinomonadaceae bacterium]